MERVELPRTMIPSLSNRMSFNRVEKLKSLQQEPDDNAFVLQANRKTFKSVSALNKFTETFGFGPDRLVVQIDAIEHCKQSASRSSRIYAKIAKKFLDDES